MINRRFVLEATTLIVAAALCAFVANAFASRDRKLRLLPTPVPTRTVSPAAGAPPTAATLTAGEAAGVATTPMPLAGPSQAPAKPVSPSSQPATRNPQPATTNAQAAAPRQFLPHPDKPWVEIDSASARELYARRIPFIDARRTSEYERGHIKGARSIPVWEADLDERLKTLYEEGLDPEAPIVVYCSGGNCEDSHMLSQRLWGLGFNNVLVYKDGYPDWVQNNGPTQTGATP